MSQFFVWSGLALIAFAVWERFIYVTREDRNERNGNQDLF